MRGPLLAGPLGSAATLHAVARWLHGARPVVVLGPAWLPAALADQVPVLGLVEAEERKDAGKVLRRARKQGHGLALGVAGVALPLALSTAGAIVVDSLAELDHESCARWIADLAPVLRPGGRLVALDATKDTAVEARIAGAFLAAALVDLVQERPREGVVLTVGVAPPAGVMAARHGASAAGATPPSAA